jgi:hypothetical protein
MCQAARFGRLEISVLADVRYELFCGEFLLRYERPPNTAKAHLNSSFCFGKPFRTLVSESFCPNDSSN